MKVIIGSCRLSHLFHSLIFAHWILSIKKCRIVKSSGTYIRHCTQKTFLSMAEIWHTPSNRQIYSPSPISAHSLVYLRKSSSEKAIEPSNNNELVEMFLKCNCACGSLNFAHFHIYFFQNRSSAIWWNQCAKISHCPDEVWLMLTVSWAIWEAADKNDRHFILRKPSESFIEAAKLR